MYPPMQISLRLCADPFVTVVEPGISVSEGLDSAGVLVELLVLPIITSQLATCYPVLKDVEIGFCLYVDLCFHASSLPCLHTFWHAIPTYYYFLIGKRTKTCTHDQQILVT